MSINQDSTERFCIGRFSIAVGLFSRIQVCTLEGVPKTQRVLWTLFLQRTVVLKVILGS